MKPIYSICIANYNMASTLKLSLESILKPLDNRFEVIVVDDGSRDKSLVELDSLALKYPILRVIPLKRDRRRKLGETRNVSVRAAKGKYVLLHIDTDDIWEPYIDSFTKIFHELEKRLFLDDFMLSGTQIQMSTKKLIIDNPYPNIYYVEDRIMWNNLAILGKLFCIKHRTFRKRIPIQGKKNKFYKALKSQFSSMSAAYSYSPSSIETTYDYIESVRVNFKNSFTFSFITLILLPPAILNGRFLKRSPLNHQFNGNSRNRNFIDLNEIEKAYIQKFGPFKLEKNEREIYFY